ncbi:MAG: glycosyl hydrolase family 28-related protein [Spirochaetota bacterium]
MMISLRILVLVLAASFACGQMTFSVRDYGAKGNGKTDDGPSIAKAFDAARGNTSVIAFEKGVYRIAETLSPPPRGRSPLQRFSFFLSGMTNCTVRGNGAKLVVTDPQMGVFRFEDCSNVTVKDLVIDYDPLPYTQGTIVDISKEQATFDLEVDDGYRTPDELTNSLSKGTGSVIIHPDGRFVGGQIGRFRCRAWSNISGRVWRGYLGAGTWWNANQVDNPLNNPLLAKGGRFWYMAASWGSIFEFRQCSDVTVQSVTAYAGHFFLGMTRGARLTVRDCTVDRLPGSTRLISTFDGMHVASQTRGPITVENSRFDWIQDDPINCHSDGQFIADAVDERTLIVRSQYSNLFQRGDTIEIVNAGVGKKGTATVGDLRFEQTNRWPPLIYTLHLERGVSGIIAQSKETNVSKADFIYNLSACGSPLIVRSNYIAHSFRTLPHTEGAVIEWNTYVSNQSSYAVTMHTDKPQAYPVLEGPQSRNIVIRNNTFIGSMIALASWTEGYDVHDIIVTNNVFSGSAQTVFRCSRGKYLLFADNRIVVPSGGAAGGPYSFLTFNGGSVVVVSNVTVKGSNASLASVIRLTNMGDTDIVINGIRLDDASVPVIENR